MDGSQPFTLHFNMKRFSGTIPITAMRKSPIPRHSPDPNIMDVAALIGESSRAAMLFSLLDGGILPASELAYRAGTSPPAASAHLAKLVAGALLRVERCGRQRLYQIASADVGYAIEALAAIAKPAKIVALTQNTIATELRAARSCYDHLAGRLGVGLTEALVARRVILPEGLLEYRVTRSGDQFFASFGVNVAEAQSKRRHFARRCIDWTEHRPHLAGSLAAAIRECFFERGWIRRTRTSRAIFITPAGRTALKEEFALEL